MIGRRVSAACVGLALAAAAGRAAAQTTVYSTGFESPTFSNGGQLVGIDGWTGLAPPPGSPPPPPNLNPSAAFITTDAPAGGSQAVRVRGSDLQSESLVAPYAAVGSYRRNVNYDTGATGLGVVTVQARVRLDGPVRTAGGDFASANVAAISGDGTAGEISISSDGRVYGYAPDADPGAAPAVQAPISLGQYHLLGVQVDFAANRVQYLVDGAPLGSPLSLPAGFTSDVLTRGSLVAYALPDAAGAARGDYTYRYDDFSVTAVPEPASAWVLGLGLLALRRRRA
jgi:hypothetical protein